MPRRISSWKPGRNVGPWRAIVRRTLDYVANTSTEVLECGHVVTRKPISDAIVTSAKKRRCEVCLRNEPQPRDQYAVVTIPASTQHGVMHLVTRSGVPVFGAPLQKVANAVAAHAGQYDVEIQAALGDVAKLREVMHNVCTIAAW